MCEGGCIITGLCEFNNAGEGVETQLGNLDLSINISQQSGYRKNVCMSVHESVCGRVCTRVCVCVHECACVCTSVRA